MTVVCCQVEVSASGWSLVQRIPTECGVSECDREASTVRRPWPTRGYRALTQESIKVWNMWLTASLDLINWLRTSEANSRGSLTFGRTAVQYADEAVVLYLRSSRQLGQLFIWLRYWIWQMPLVDSGRALYHTQTSPTYRLDKWRNMTEGTVINS